MNEMLQTWGLNKLPFENLGGEGLYYPAQQHREAIGRAMFAVKACKAGALIVGDYGVGKTFVKNLILNSLNADAGVLALSEDNALVTPSELLEHLISKLAPLAGGSQPEAGYSKSPASLEDRLVTLAQTILARDGRRIVILFDELQNVGSPGTIEQIRLLMNHVDTSGRPLFTFLLFGQYSLLELLERSPSFLQRVAVRWRILPLTAEQASEYIRHRLFRAGASREIFTKEAMTRIHVLSKGCPRAINNLCDICLHFAQMNQRFEIGEDLVDAVSRDIDDASTNGELRV
jgi:general secretion pathway protein A